KGKRGEKRGGRGKGKRRKGGRKEKEKRRGEREKRNRKKAVAKAVRQTRERLKSGHAAKSSGDLDVLKMDVASVLQSA
ncbi:hypothetical protein ACC721_37495, partial [Rhizobium ruizarguesonis]